MGDASFTGETKPKSESFLSPSIAASISNIRQNYSTLFDLAQSFDNLGIRVLSDEWMANAQNGSNQQLIAATLFLRTLGSFQALYLLAERGLLADARTILRSATETVIWLVAVGKNEEVCNYLVAGDKSHRQKLGKAWLEIPQAVTEMTASEKTTTEDAIQSIHIEKASTKIADLARKADVEALYQTIYRLTSGDAAHPTLGALSRHVEEDANGYIRGLKFGPDVGDLEKTLFDAISVLGFAIDAVVKLFQIQNVEGELSELVKNWKKLSNYPKP